jgi:hypothetical protein
MKNNTINKIQEDNRYNLKVKLALVTYLPIIFGLYLIISSFPNNYNKEVIFFSIISIFIGIGLYVNKTKIIDYINRN